MEDNLRYQGHLYIGGLGRNWWRIILNINHDLPLLLRILTFAGYVNHARKGAKNDIFTLWHSKNSKDLQKLRQAGAIPSIVREYENLLLFPPEQLTQFENEWYSRELSALDEIKLVAWAQSENAAEAYRFTFLPSFHPSIVYKIWTNPSKMVTFKAGKVICGVTADIETTVTQNIDTATWHAFLELIETEDFWTILSWNTVPPNTFGMDGARLLMEGWKDGNYKFLSDWSPRRDSPMGKAALFFDALYSNPNLEEYLILHTYPDDFR